ncbi:prolyl oligopeptidase family serine peptidase [Opitutales bacterium ASA1]|uniref:prolyl oligopeptidase family serine peptidase n=1 Tax=Congregicoccus parvus TaxID=3081749 RepID=UPI002B2EB623|nr:prolyl oligopeptidase family serine peptidase [Opitutales bacterium ASA1]
MSSSSSASPLRYPETKTVDVVDHYHGVAVADPYRWLEDDNSAETKAWVEAQNRVTFGYLEGLSQREAFKRRLAQLLDFERFGLPHERGGRYFFTRNEGLQNQSVLWVAESLDAEPVVLLDPNTLSVDGTTALTGYAVSEDGRWLAYGLAVAGSDWNEWRVRDVATRQDTGDLLQWVKFSGCSWAKDGSGFYYSRYDAPAEGAKLTGVNEHQKLCFHRLGTPQSEDRVVYVRPDHPKWGFGGRVTEDGAYLVVHVWQGTERKNRVHYRRLTTDSGERVSDDAAFVPLLDDFDAAYHFIGNDGPIFWFETDADAPKQRIIAVDTRNPGRAHRREIVPESDATLRDAAFVGGRFVLQYLRNAHSEVKTFLSDGTPAEAIELPGIGTASGFGGRADATETFYAFTGFTTPGTIYRHDFVTGRSTIWKQPRVDFDLDAYETSQVFYPSRDGTRVSMFLTHRKGLKRDGSNPVLLYGYGGFDVSLTPAFSTTNLAWMERGGIYAVPNLRGGGEYGREWHEAGTKLSKQNVFDDFIAAAEWLVAEGWTTRERLGIYGGSNGGLLVGACMTQRPELFGACVPAVGVMDMLRFHKFTIGWAWTSDYGSSDDAEQFAALHAYSPLHNLREGTCYPPTLVTTADHDDRVVPAHSFKFAARLQAVQACDAPVLVRIDVRAGHGAGKPTAKVVEEGADRLAFLAEHLGME